MREEGLSVLGWRDTPINDEAIGRIARASRPYIEQVFIHHAAGMDQDALERKLYVIRKRAEAEIAASALRDKSYFYLPSLSSRTIVYKGLLLAPQIASFYRELSNPELVSALCLVHQRFSTNTFPTWQLAHPFRYLCHNGEINTLRGNVNWMHARQSVLASPLFGDDIKKLFPICTPGGSDSAQSGQYRGTADAGRAQPAARDGHADPGGLGGRQRDGGREKGILRVPRLADRALGRPGGHRLHRRPRDRRHPGPQRAAPSALPGDAQRPGDPGVGDRRAPREAGRGARSKAASSLAACSWWIPGKAASSRTRSSRQRLAARQPYGEWIQQNQVTLDHLPEPTRWHPTEYDSILQRQREFGYTDEDLRMILTPMAVNGTEPLGSMGVDTPLACLSDLPQPLFNYFKQLFAQVTNPPIDPIREELVMSLESFIGSERNLLDETPQHCHTLKLSIRS